jgi:hypothetical protein
MPNFEIENRVQNQTRENGSDATSQRLLEGAMILGRSAAGGDNELQRGDQGGGGGGQNHLERQLPRELDFCAAPLKGFDSTKLRSLDPGEDVGKNDRSRELEQKGGVSDKHNSDKSAAKGPGLQYPWERREDGRGLQPRQNQHRPHQVAPSPRFWS